MKADVLSVEVVGLPENSLSSVMCWTSNVWDQREIVFRSVDESPKTSSNNSNVCRRTTERKVSILMNCLWYNIVIRTSCKFHCPFSMILHRQERQLTLKLNSQASVFRLQTSLTLAAQAHGVRCACVVCIISGNLFVSSLALYRNFMTDGAHFPLREADMWNFPFWAHDTTQELLHCQEVAQHSVWRHQKCYSSHDIRPISPYVENLRRLWNETSCRFKPRMVPAGWCRKPNCICVHELSESFPWCTWKAEFTATHPQAVQKQKANTGYE